MNLNKRKEGHMVVSGEWKKGRNDKIMISENKIF